MSSQQEQLEAKIKAWYKGLPDIQMPNLESEDGTTLELNVGELADFITALIQEAEKRGENAGRADELVKLSEWGKTIDDQWNAHFKERLDELSGGSNNEY